jgi:hypothetical protein
MRSFRGRMILLSVLAFAYGVWCIYMTRRDLVLATNSAAGGQAIDTEIFALGRYIHASTACAGLKYA